jgi:plastocyanin
VSAGRRLVLAALLVIGFPLGACSSSSGNGEPFSVPGEPVATAQVDAPRSYRFEPAVIQVQRGTTVTWTNHDQFPHTVQLLTGSDRSTRDLGIGKSVTIGFDQPGDYYYRCSLHPAQMHGKVIVK